MTLKRRAIPYTLLLVVSAVAMPLGLAASQQVATQQATLTAVQASDHVGQRATVCGVVASSRYAASSRGQPTFLNLDKPYPKQVFTVVIWGDARRNFPEPPERAFSGKRVCVTGAIETYRGTPQIVVREPRALRLAP
jgi:DNA/RNA endonuclease YhcR with UshA esterase domain